MILQVWKLQIGGMGKDKNIILRIDRKLLFIAIYWFSKHEKYFLYKKKSFPQ